MLKNTKHYVESSDPEMLQRLLKDEVIGPLRAEGTEGLTTSIAPTLAGLVIPGTKDAAGVQQAAQRGAERLIDGEIAKKSEIEDILNTEDDDDEVDAVHSFEIIDNGVEAVQKRCLELGLPVLEEYDFRNDKANPDLDIDLRPSAQIRHYQEKSLSKMFGNGRAKSGIIVLPCGAGKTLVGNHCCMHHQKGYNHILYQFYVGRPMAAGISKVVQHQPQRYHCIHIRS